MTVRTATLVSGRIGRPLQVANVEGVLRVAVARMLALELAMGLLLGLGLFQRNELGLGQYQAFRRDREPALPQLVGDANLAESRLLDGNRNERRLRSPVRRGFSALASCG